MPGSTPDEALNELKAGPLGQFFEKSKEVTEKYNDDISRSKPTSEMHRGMTCIRDLYETVRRCVLIFLNLHKQV